MNTTSTVTRLRLALEGISQRLAELIRDIPIKHLDRYGREVVIVAPEYYWGEPSAEQRNAQIQLKRKYDSLSERLRIFVGQAPTDVARKLDDADKRFRTWLELDSNWSLSYDRDKNEHSLRSDAKALEEILDILEAGPRGETILVPDTNSLLTSPDPVRYREIATQDQFTFLLLPTVLGELDELKIMHRNPEVREKAKKAINRIKGWRRQGSLREGLTVGKSITVKAFHSEPDMDNTLSWLDKEVSDDRILANVLAIQAQYPGARVILVTEDINLQNKADAAFIEVAEFEDA